MPENGYLAIAVSGIGASHRYVEHRSFPKPAASAVPLTDG